jgi:hypothetical protein
MIALRESPTAINKRYESRSKIDGNQIIISNNNCCDQIDATESYFIAVVSDEFLLFSAGLLFPLSARLCSSHGNSSKIPTWDKWRSSLSPQVVSAMVVVLVGAVGAVVRGRVGGAVGVGVGVFVGVFVGSAVDAAFRAAFGGAVGTAVVGGGAKWVATSLTFSWLYWSGLNANKDTTKYKECH